MGFAEIEKTVYAAVCEIARKMTVDIIDGLEQKLFENRDKKRFVVKTKKATVIKTIYGEVAYSRRWYNDIETGENVFLLDKVYGMQSVGRLSAFLAEIVAIEATQKSFRRAAESIKKMTGQTISHQAIWNVVQKLGDGVKREEKNLVSFMRAGQQLGQGEPPVLFEEMDGVYISMQGKSRNKSKRKRELKVSMAYSGWLKGKKKCRKLTGKVMTAGFHSTNEFHTVREAAIRNKYNVDEVKLRVVNGDGAAWIQNVQDADTIFQLDNFHIQRELLRCIRNKEIGKNLRSMLRERKIDHALDYLETYSNSVEGKEREDALTLLSYLSSNKDSLIPYKERGLDIPEPPEGIEYKNMGAQEANNYSVITYRMKNNRTSWSINGGTNMAKLLTCIENGKLEDIIGNFLYRNLDVNLKRQYSLHEPSLPLSANQSPAVAGKGYDPHVHLPLLDSSTSPELAKLKKLIAESVVI